MAVWLSTVKQWARSLKIDVVALWIAARDPRTPILAKIVAGAVAAYALSPIDLIPDFVPILGYLDDLLIVPLGIMLAIKLVPGPLMQGFRAAALSRSENPTSRSGVAIIVSIWIVCIAVVGWLMWQQLGE